MSLHYNSGLPDRSPESVKQAQSSPKDDGQWYSMDEEYGLEDMEAIRSEGQDTPSIEDEYKSYVSTPISRHPDDLVGFWEVISY